MTVEKFNSGFSTLGLALPLLKMLERQGLSEPTTIQKQSIPIILRGEDVIGLSQTGTGKTAAFILPLLSNLYRLERKGKYRPVRSLILSPTREIVKQIDDVTRPFLSTVNLKSIALYGGVPILKQMRTLRRGSDIVIGTPGRIEDHISEGTLDISRVQSFVLDEADQMLDIGFLPAIERICHSIPPERQTLLFSATMSSKVKALAQSFLNKPKQIIISDQKKISKHIDQKVIFLKPEEKIVELQMILRRKMANRVLVFSRTKYAVDKLVKICTRIGFNLNSIHGDKSQAKREEALAYFKRGNGRILVATDIAARGLDLPNVDLIINFDLPTSAEIYIHRVGRTARAGKSGQVISFCSYHERESLRMIEKFIKQNLRVSARLGKSIEDHSSAAIKRLRTRHSKKK